MTDVSAPVTVPVKKPKGRPKGSQNKSQGMPLNKRLKVLQKIALDNSQKSTDRIAAINLITQLLNDKVKDAELGLQTTIVQFKEENVEKNTKQTEIKTEEIKIKPVEANTTTTTTTTEVPKKEVVKEENTLELNFSFEEEHGNSNSQTTSISI